MGKKKIKYKYNFYKFVKSYSIVKQKIRRPSDTVYAEEMLESIIFSKRGG